jgi:hypothetical protein
VFIRVHPWLKILFQVFALWLIILSTVQMGLNPTVRASASPEGN